MKYEFLDSDSYGIVLERVIHFLSESWVQIWRQIFRLKL